jgi:ATP-dependent Clp protease ATP-binding subunit ClpA
MERRVVAATERCEGNRFFEKGASGDWCSYLAGLTGYLESAIAGQSGAMTRISRAIQSAELGLNNTGSRAKASFLFLGPTGVGKTESAKRFTEYLFGGRSAIELIFMNEYSLEHRFAEFLDRAEAAIRKHPQGTTLLFDEIEKAHPRLIDLFLSLLEEGMLTTQGGERLAVTPFYLVLTSNLGSGDLARIENAPYSMLERVALEVASQSLRPELFARITERIVFRPLTLEVQRRIIESLIAEKLEILSEHFGKFLTIDPGPVAAFLLRSGYNRAQGARLLKQEVDRQFNIASLRWALSGQSPVEGKFFYDVTTGCLVLR